jgi:adenosylcobinamide-phosphate synthase
MFAYRNLRRRVADVASALATKDLPEARRLAGRHLVSRDTAQLAAPEVAGAAIESLAENVTDSLTAPLLAYTIGGLPAAWAYRFVNTADAMWGYRTDEYEQLGKFPARFDDILNWLPARLTGWLLVVAAVLAGENGRRSAQVMVHQHRQTSSPNAGWTMSARPSGDHDQTRLVPVSRRQFRAGCRHDQAGSPHC